MSRRGSFYRAQAVQHRLSQRFKINPVLALILLLGLAHGLLYTLLVPPWQHYDEPTHFEYAWLAANRPAWPEPGDYDQAMRREVAASMLEHGFFKNLEARPDLLARQEPVWIGVSQVVDPPFYYFLTSLPLRLLRYSDVTLQLYAARLVSLALFLVTILAAWGATSEVLQPSHPLVWMVPATLALIPGFVDMMTALNNDVGATAVFSLFLWGSLRLLRRGLSVFGLLWVISTAGLAVLTKATIYIAVPLALAALILALFKGNRRWLAWTAISAAVLALIAVTFTWGDAACWYRDVTQPAPTRANDPISPVGDHSLRVELDPGYPAPRIVQPVPAGSVKELSGKTVTLGAWIWSSEPVIATIPILKSGEGELLVLPETRLSSEPEFFTVSASLPSGAARLWINLAPTIPSADKKVTIHFDGLVLAEGERPAGSLPEFDDKRGNSGRWGNDHFANHIRNGSAESSWPTVNPRIDSLLFGYFPARPSLILPTLLDQPGAGWYYLASVVNLVNSFWAKFGWGNVSLVSSKLYSLLGIFSLLGLFGSIWGAWRRRTALPWDILFLLLLSLIGIWGSALWRAVESVLGPIFLPSARYAYPAIIPTAILLNFGWLQIMRFFGCRLHFSPKNQVVLYLLSFCSLDAIALSSLILYYMRS